MVLRAFLLRHRWSKTTGKLRKRKEAVSKAVNHHCKGGTPSQSASLSIDEFILIASPAKGERSNNDFCDNLAKIICSVWLILPKSALRL